MEEEAALSEISAEFDYSVSYVSFANIHILIFVANFCMALSYQQINSLYLEMLLWDDKWKAVYELQSSYNLTAQSQGGDALVDSLCNLKGF